MPVGSIFQFATDRTKAQVLPFQWKKWFKIAVLLALSGAMTSGSCNFNFNSPAKSKAEKQKVEAARQEAGQDAAQVQSAAAVQPAQGQAQKSPVNPMAMVWLMAVLGLAAILLAVAFSWYVSPLTLGLFDFLTQGDLNLRGMLSRYRREGNDVFLFSWGFLLLNFIILGAVVTAAVIIKNAVVIGLAVIVSLLAIICLVLVAVAWPLVVGLMYLQKMSVMQALKKIIKDKLSIGQFLLLGLLNIGIGIVLGILGMLVFLAVILAVGLVFGLPVLAGVLILKALPALKIVLFIAGSIWAVLAVLTGIILGFALYAPLSLWSAYFNYAFLHRVHPELVFFAPPAEPTVQPVS